MNRLFMNRNKKKENYKERFSFSPLEWVVSEKAYERCREKVGCSRTSPMPMEVQKKEFIATQQTVGAFITSSTDLS
jgi:hypothetical protein